MKSQTKVILPENKKPKLIFFAGKGGVGKTSMSCVTALYLAEKGFKTLLLTTDPASHIGEVFEQPIGDKIQPIAGVENLYGLKIDPKQAAEEYKERIFTEAAKNNYSEEMMMGLREELDSPCTEEMAAFDRFTDYADNEEFDAIIFDTAPTGHTLRLLELPLSWNKQIELKTAMNTVNEGDLKAQERFKRVISKMRDKEQTTFAFVVYPENTPIQEAYRAVEELKGAEIYTQLVIANQVLPEEYCTTAYFQKRKEMQDKHLKVIHEKFDCEILQMPLFAEEIKGIDTIREAANALYK
ncbi:ArsA family ATPase [Geosporobacter ferrireducens]|uniref:Arsenic-transporting ATPase n=1 Tax=Geosporobacter ferrireducens TaxID=1424294 RepID=A0A1D8GEA1_9FIRM|nr:ArsA family ATPase [Geosporobacter ferrireducens]AOT69234.1 arsenic-transporting ATPase [Geosporobacter ferrireducens]